MTSMELPDGQPCTDGSTMQHSHGLLTADARWPKHAVMR